MLDQCMAKDMGQAGEMMPRETQPRVPRLAQPRARAQTAKEPKAKASWPAKVASRGHLRGMWQSQAVASPNTKSPGLWEKPAWSLTLTLCFNNVAELHYPPPRGGCQETPVSVLHACVTWWMLAQQTEGGHLSLHAWQPQGFQVVYPHPHPHPHHKSWWPYG